MLPGGIFHRPTFRVALASKSFLGQLRECVSRFFLALFGQLLPFGLLPQLVIFSRRLRLLLRLKRGLRFLRFL